MVYGAWSLSPVRQRILRILNWVTVLLLVSLLLQVIGCFSPGWIYVKVYEVEIHVGLWYIRMCIQDECETQSLEKVTGNEYVSDLLGIGEYRGETISAIIICLAAVIALRISRTRLYTPHSNNVLVPIIITGVSILLTGILATTAAGKMGDSIRKADRLLELIGTNESPYRFPYSLFMTGVGGVIGLVAFLLLLASQPWQLQNENQSPPQQGTQPGVYPAQKMPIQTVYSQDQPPMYAKTPPKGAIDNSQTRNSYYVSGV